MDVAQTALRFVQQIFRLTQEQEQPPRDRHFLIFGRENAFIIFDGDRNLGHAERFARARAVEDDVLHHIRVNRSGCRHALLLAKDPSECAIHDVRLTAACSGRR